MADYSSKLIYNNCFSLGLINYKNGDKYRGQFKDGRPCGFGTLKYLNSLIGSNGINEEATYEG